MKYVIGFVVGVIATVIFPELVPLGREVLLNYPLGAYFFGPPDPPSLFSSANLTLGGGRLPFF